MVGMIAHKSIWNCLEMRTVVTHFGQNRPKNNDDHHHHEHEGAAVRACENHTNEGAAVRAVMHNFERLLYRWQTYLR